MSDSLPRLRFRGASRAPCRLALPSLPLAALSWCRPAPATAHGTEARYVEVADWPRAGVADSVIAHSAPIYVVVDDEPNWKADEVPGIVAAARAQRQRLLVEPLVAEAEARYAKLLEEHARYHREAAPHAR